MARCTVCGKQAPYRCRYCGDTLCKEHLAPGMHWCVGLEAYKNEVGAEGASSLYERPERGGWGKNTNPLSIFSGNYSFLLLFLIAISFVLQFIPGYTEHLILNPIHLIERPWTLITYVFLHRDIWHFILNMFFMVFFAPVLERKIGSTKFLLIFFLSGIVAGIGWSLTSVSPAVGASGALCGIFATLAVLMPRMKVYLFFLLPLEMWMAVILFALFDFIMIGSGDMIAHTAHLSGLFFGLLAGLILKET
jgi:membrane associated rhomboid family serine protease